MQVLLAVKTLNCSRAFSVLPAWSALSVDFNPLTAGESLRCLTFSACLKNIYSCELFRLDFQVVFCLWLCVLFMLKPYRLSLLC